MFSVSVNSCEEGDGYFYSIDKDDLKKLKFIKEKEES